MPGRIVISCEREPEFSTGCDATGENATVLVARDLDAGVIAGVACRSERDVYVNGRRRDSAISASCESIAVTAADGWCRAVSRCSNNSTIAIRCLAIWPRSLQAIGKPRGFS